VSIDITLGTIYEYLVTQSSRLRSMLAEILCCVFGHSSGYLHIIL
jgi:hypothetical protein